MPDSSKTHKGRGAALLLVAVAYVCAMGAGYGAVYLGTPSHGAPVLAMALLFSVSTAILFGFSRVLDNNSMFDAWWSVAPVAALPLLVGAGGVGWDQVGLRHGLIVGLVGLWGLRLTLNWATGWAGMAHEDWRYRDLRTQHGPRFWLVSAAGIHGFPALLVFGGMLAAWAALADPRTSVGVADALAALFTLGAILIETVADLQLRAFTRVNQHPERFLDRGLWGWSRHPNYFGELSFWWGLFFLALAASPAHWWTGVGAVAMSLLFWFISIPMLDKRNLSRRRHYRLHMRRVSRLVPWFPRR